MSEATRPEVLEELRQRAERMREAKESLHQGCLDALADGVPRVDVSKATGVSRVTLIKWERDTQQ